MTRKTGRPRIWPEGPAETYSIRVRRLTAAKLRQTGVERVRALLENFAAADKENCKKV